MSSDFVRVSEASSGEVLRRFLSHGRLLRARLLTETLRQVATAFARLPYENLTKILRASETGSVEEARRLPGEVLQDHYQWGTGGTCFSLTWTLLHLVQALGFTAVPILADRHYGVDTHCALLVWINGEPHLLDPGYLLVEPLALPRQGEVVVPTSFHQVKLAVQGEKIALSTIEPGREVKRLEYKPRPVDTATFLKVWDASFKWDMMKYPVLSRIEGGRQVYVQKSSVLVRGLDASERRELGEAELREAVTRHFGIAPHIVNRALDLLHRRGER